MPGPLIVQSLQTGDYFRLWPDGRACEIESEDDFRDVCFIATLEPTRRSTAKFCRAEQGNTFVRWTLEECDECSEERTGWRREGLGSYTSDGEDYRLVRCWCDDGWRYTERGVLISRAELPFDAEAVAAFAPLSLDSLKPAMVMDLVTR